MSELVIKPIAYVYNDYQAKFGVPRQSGVVEEVTSRVVFLPEYRRAEALRGLEGFSHIWLIWQFSQGFAADTAAEWSPTVRPPMLGGNTRVGVFASRSPRRPNPLGLSAVRLLKIEYDAPDAPALLVAGADCVSGTPVFDVKPYVPYADAIPDALGGFAVPKEGHRLTVDFPPVLLQKLPRDKQAAVMSVLAADPRPAYQNDPERVYGVSFGGFNLRFTVEGENLSVCKVEKTD